MTIIKKVKERTIMTNETNENKKTGYQVEIKKLFDRLEAGVKSTFISENFKNYLDLMSKFYNYSSNNVCLILMQCPNASMVASASKWKSLGRYIKKGSKAIRILIPNFYKKKIETEETDENDKPIIIEKDAVYFSIGNVFDIEQTEGEELPTICRELQDNSEELKSLIDVVTEVAKIPVAYWNLKDGSKGFYSKQKNQIVIKSNMPTLQTCKTLVHEVAHSRLHCEETGKTRQVKEIEAESIAFVVCSYFGLDTSEYSFEYVANWSRDKETKELKEILNSIQKEAKKLIQEIESKMTKSEVA